MCLKHQFLSKYSIISAKVADCFVPRGVDRLDAKVHHSRHICLLGFVGFKNRAAREITTQFARAIKTILNHLKLRLKGLGYAILGNFSIDQMVIKLTEITK